ncbi:MAG: hypothetical protein IVW57_03145 [Ktedonobacterales bacterium]|nr:hypothetical protein [Ktedonobacterales bacterium]
MAERDTHPQRRGRTTKATTGSNTTNTNTNTSGGRAQTGQLRLMRDGQPQQQPQQRAGASEDVLAEPINSEQEQALLKTLPPLVPRHTGNFSVVSVRRMQRLGYWFKHAAGATQESYGDIVNAAAADGLRITKTWLHFLSRLYTDSVDQRTKRERINMMVVWWLAEHFGWRLADLERYLNAESESAWAADVTHRADRVRAQFLRMPPDVRELAERQLDAVVTFARSREQRRVPLDVEADTLLEVFRTLTPEARQSILQLVRVQADAERTGTHLLPGNVTPLPTPAATAADELATDQATYEARAEVQRGLDALAERSAQRQQPGQRNGNGNGGV